MIFSSRLPICNFHLAVSNGGVCFLRPAVARHGFIAGYLLKLYFSYAIYYSSDL